MKALVTGGTGFIGSHVVEDLLAAGHSVRVLSRKQSDSAGFSGDVEVYQGNLEDPPAVIRAMKGMDILFHVGEVENTSKSAAEKNVMLISAIIPAMKAEEIRRLVFVSSLSVSGIPASTPADEETPASVTLSDHYTAYKRLAEHMLKEKSTGFEYVIVRPAPVYGPRSRHLGRLIDVIEKFGPVGIPFPGRGDNIAPLIHVSDLAHAIARAGTVPEAAGQTFNITDGLRHSWRDFFAAIAKSVGKDLRIIPLPLLLLKLAAVPFDLFSMFLGVNLDPVSYINYFSKDLFFDNSKAKRILDWSPRYSLAEGVEDMVRFYRGK